MKSFKWMVLMLVAAIAGCTQTHVIDTPALQATAPADWQVAEHVLTPSLVSPNEILSVGTFELRPGGDCWHMPGKAMEDLGTTDVLISVQEANGVVGPNFIVRPASFEPLLTGAQGDALGCIAQDQRADIGVLVWQPFKDQGRSFYLLVAMGADVDDGTRADAVEFLDGISFEN